MTSWNTTHSQLTYKTFQTPSGPNWIWRLDLRTEDRWRVRGEHGQVQEEQEEPELSAQGWEDGEFPQGEEQREDSGSLRKDKSPTKYILDIRKLNLEAKLPYCVCRTNKTFYLGVLIFVTLGSQHTIIRLLSRVIKQYFCLDLAFQSQSLQSLHIILISTLPAPIACTRLLALWA